MAYTRADLEALKERLNAIDPDFVLASKEVDRATLSWSLGLRPMERVRHAQSMHRAITRLRRAKSSS